MLFAEGSLVHYRQSLSRLDIRDADFFRNMGYDVPSWKESIKRQIRLIRKHGWSEARGLLWAIVPHGFVDMDEKLGIESMFHQCARCYYTELR